VERRKMKGSKNSKLIQVKIVGHEDVIMVVEAPKSSKVEIKINSKIVDHEDIPMIIAHEDVALLTISHGNGSRDSVKITLNPKPKK
jgi:hypothetical protein